MLLILHKLGINRVRKMIEVKAKCKALNWCGLNEIWLILYKIGFPSYSVGKESTCNAGDPVQLLGGKDPLEKG